MKTLIQQSLGLDVSTVTINDDGYSLNSLNGVVVTTDGVARFFKFHQEEGETALPGEYYRADLLASAGYPVDQPTHSSTVIGHQILLYDLRKTPRLADLCLAVEHGRPVISKSRLTAAQERLDRLIGERMVADLHIAAPGQARAEPIHQLFHHRLADRPFGDRPGARLVRFYHNRNIDLPASGSPSAFPLGWRDFSTARWVINGQERRDTVEDIFRRALITLHPDRFEGGPVVTAHGDAHNANVWFDDGDNSGGDRLTFFDPAFAGQHIPALLAEVKATFHNIFAHPFWLYHPDDSTATVSARYADGVLHVDHDWRPTPLRAAFLDSKIRNVWKPLIAALDHAGTLPPDWMDVIGLALFCCPTLVMPLTTDPPPGFARRHTPSTALLGWSLALACASPPVGEPAPSSDPYALFARIMRPAP